MPNLNLKPTHKPIRDYYATLKQYQEENITHEGAVSLPFETLLNICTKQIDAIFIPQYGMETEIGNRIIVDGAIKINGLFFAYWEAKDIDDDLDRAVQQKRQAGYPQDNILFQTPERGILVQNGQTALDLDISDPENLITVLKHLFAYTTPTHEDWQKAVADFRSHVPDLAKNMMELIEQRYETDAEFKKAFTDFYEVCRTAINPNLSRDAVEEMLIQHIITERIFRTVFERSDFTRRNIIAREIENVSDTLMRHAVSRDAFLKPLDRFYNAIEQAATLCRDFSQKQHLLNTFYEKFFQGFSEDVADTHGIVYTPQPIVDFMVNSVSHILKTEFGRSLSDTGVHIIDPFVGTGNFIVRLMQDIQGTTLEEKYRHELHCNEVMLLPYYIASLNIEQEFYQRTQTYLPFEGITLADTFELLEDQQMTLFTQENTERVERQKASDMFVVIGNPPYNASQVNENDNNKNRKYEMVDKVLQETYTQDSKATNKNALSDPYVKAILWASRRIGEEGIVAYVTNNSFLDGIAFDGMRKHLYQDFNRIYILDLKGNVRKDSMREGIPIGEKHTIFGLAAMVGITVTFFVKSRHYQYHKIYYSGVDWKATRQEKFNRIENANSINGIEWKEIIPDNRHTWLTEGLNPDFDTFIPIGTKKAKAVKGAAVDVLFKTYSRGINTSRDAWVYNFNRNTLTENVTRMIETYNTEVVRWTQHTDRETSLDDFVEADNIKINWSEGLKRNLQSGKTVNYSQENVRLTLYRPFTKSNLYFDRMINERVYVFPSIFPTHKTETENRVICLTTLGSKKPFHCLVVQQIADVHLNGDSQCFPFYTYNEDGTNRKENITDWALAAFRKHYSDDSISKLDIFYYTYGILHHPMYREKYQANLKRDLPHIPFAEDFWGFANAGAQLADIHVNYESHPKYDGLKYIETPDMPIDWRVKKMKMSKDKTQLVYNDFLTIDGIPTETFDYRLGTRSALEWVIDQYRVKVDKRSGLVNDPNRADAPRYIVDLIGRIISVSLRTVKIVKGLPSSVGASSAREKIEPTPLL